MNFFKLFTLFYFVFVVAACYAQPVTRLDTLNAFILDSIARHNCCKTKNDFLNFKNEFVRRIENKESLSVETAKWILDRKYRNVEFFSEDEINNFIKELMRLDISYDNNLRFEIFYQLLKNYRINIGDKDSLLLNSFKIREQFYLQVIQFQEFNRMLANKMRDLKDTVLFLRINDDVLGDVNFALLSIGDEPENFMDNRISDKLFEVQMAAFWDRVDYYNKTANKKELERIRDSNYFLFQIIKAQPNFNSRFNQILERNHLEVIPTQNNSRKGN